MPSIISSWKEQRISHRVAHWLDCFDFNERVTPVGWNQESSQKIYVEPPDRPSFQNLVTHQPKENANVCIYVNCERNLKYTGLHSLRVSPLNNLKKYVLIIKIFFSRKCSAMALNSNLFIDKIPMLPMSTPVSVRLLYLSCLRYIRLLLSNGLCSDCH